MTEPIHERRGIPVWESDRESVAHSQTCVRVNSASPSPNVPQAPSIIKTWFDLRVSTANRRIIARRQTIRELGSDSRQRYMEDRWTAVIHIRKSLLLMEGSMIGIVQASCAMLE